MCAPFLRFTPDGGGMDCQAHPYVRPFLRFRPPGAGAAKPGEPARTGRHFEADGLAAAPVLPPSSAHSSIRR